MQPDLRVLPLYDTKAPFCSLVVHSLNVTLLRRYEITLSSEFTTQTFLATL